MSCCVWWEFVAAGKDKIEVKNYFKHRTDCLLSKILECRDKKVIESFAPGRQRSLKGTLTAIPLSAWVCGWAKLWASNVMITVELLIHYGHYWDHMKYPEMMKVFFLDNFKKENFAVMCSLASTLLINSAWVHIYVFNGTLKYGHTIFHECRDFSVTPMDTKWCFN